MVPSGNSRVALSRAQLWLFSTALVIAALDQAVKRVVVDAMQLGQSIDVLGSIVRLTRTSNTGGAFGLLRGRGNWFIVVSFAAALRYRRDVETDRKREADRADSPSASSWAGLWGI